MSFARQAAKSGLWFAGSRLIIQVFSWAVTIAIARILSPGDYGLMAMASILTGYVEIFSELGLGAAIIQKKEINQNELSSIFWFCMIVGLVFAVVSFGLAYPTAWLFNESRVVPITEMISVSFILGSLMIVPYNILTREVKFKEIGVIQLIAVVTSSLSMLLMAHGGFGVWTLVIGIIIQRTVNVVLTFRTSKWRPTLHYNFAETKSLLKFGLNVAGARTFFYLFQKSDKLVVGKIFNAVQLGYYSFAMELASIPTDRIVAIIYQVSFPVFSRYQDDKKKCADMYLKTTKYVALIVAPLFGGGYFLGEEIIWLVLGNKWMPIVPLFKILCVSQFMMSLTVISNVLNTSQGRAHWTMLFHLSNALLLPFSLFIVSRYGFNALIIPWITLYPVICSIWILMTIRTLNIMLLQYLKCLAGPVVSTLGVMGGIWSVQSLFHKPNLTGQNLFLFANMAIGAILYIAYLFLGEKKSLSEVWSLRKGMS